MFLRNIILMVGFFIGSVSVYGNGHGYPKKVVVRNATSVNARVLGIIERDGDKYTTDFQYIEEPGGLSCLKSGTERTYIHQKGLGPNLGLVFYATNWGTMLDNAQGVTSSLELSPSGASYIDRVMMEKKHFPVFFHDQNVMSEETYLYKNVVSASPCISVLYYDENKGEEVFERCLESFFDEKGNEVEISRRNKLINLKIEIMLGKDENDESFWYVLLTETLERDNLRFILDDEGQIPGLVRCDMDSMWDTCK